jgi:hypothetical protein
MLATHLLLVLPLLMILIARFLVSLFNYKKYYMKILAVLLLSLIIMFGVFKYGYIYERSKNDSLYEKNMPKYAKAHQSSALYFKNTNNKIILGIYIPVYFIQGLLSSSYASVILCEPVFEGSYWRKYGYSETYPFPSVNCINAKKLINENINDTNARWMFASFSRSENKDLSIYYDFCAIKDLEKNFCYKPFLIFIKEVSKNNMTMILEHSIKDSKGKPVYDIYKLSK